MKLDIGSSLGYAFRDPNWPNKAGIAVAAVVVAHFLSNIPIVNLLALPLALVVGVALLGWQVQIVRTVAAGRGDELPDWSDVAGLMTRGTMLFLAQLVWLLPALVLLAAGGAVGLYHLLSGSGGLHRAGPEILKQGGMLAGLGLAAVGFLLTMAIGAILPAVTMRYAATLRLGEAFNFGAVFESITRSIGNFAMIFLMGIGLGLVGMVVVFPVSMVLGLIPLLGPPLTAFVTAPVSVYTSVVLAHLMGQYQRVCIEPLGLSEPRSLASEGDPSAPSPWQSPSWPASDRPSAQPDSPEASWESPTQAQDWRPDSDSQPPVG